MHFIFIGTVEPHLSHGCFKCKLDSQTDYAQKNQIFRTDSNFRRQTFKEHHQKNPSTRKRLVSPLQKLQIDMIDDFPTADLLFSIELGVINHCFNGIWMCDGPTAKHNFLFQNKTNVFEWLCKAGLNLPTELDSASLCLGGLNHMILFYLGPVILKTYLPAGIYEHFLNLFCAITICSSRYHIRENTTFLPLAGHLLQNYVDKFVELYGVDQITYQIHDLIHLVDDVERFGALPGISSHQFLNMWSIIRDLITNSLTKDYSLREVANNLSLYSKLNRQVSTIGQLPQLRHELFSEKQKPFRYMQAYKMVHLMDGIILSTDDKDKWFMTHDDKIVEMLSAHYWNGEFRLYGRNLINLSNFFERPVESKLLGIYAADKADVAVSGKSYKLSEIKCKLVSVDMDGDGPKTAVFYPLLETLNAFNRK